MEEQFCNQANAYPDRATAASDVAAIHVYEELKDAIELVEQSLSDTERLLVLWQSGTLITLEIDRIGYFGQMFLVFSGRDADAIGEDTVEWTSLVPARSAYVLLKTTSRKMGDTFRTINFTGHAMKPKG